MPTKDQIQRMIMRAGTNLAENDILEPELSDRVDDDLAYALASVGYYQAAFSHEPSLARAEIVSIEHVNLPGASQSSKIRIIFDPPIGESINRYFDIPTPSSTPADNEFMRLMAQVGDEINGKPIDFNTVARMDGATVPLYYNEKQDKLDVEIRYSESGNSQTEAEAGTDMVSNAGLKSFSQDEYTLPLIDSMQTELIATILYFVCCAFLLGGTVMGMVSLFPAVFGQFVLAVVFFWFVVIWMRKP